MVQCKRCDPVMRLWILVGFVAPMASIHGTSHPLSMAMVTVAMPAWDLIQNPENGKDQGLIDFLNDLSHMQWPSWCSLPRMEPRTSVCLGTSLLSKDLSYGVHVGQKQWVLNNSTPNMALGAKDDGLEQAIIGPSQQPYAGWNLQHAVSSSLNIVYELNVGKRTALTESMHEPYQETIGQTSSLNSYASSDALSDSLLMDQATAFPTEHTSYRFFAEALITFVYSFCNNRDK